MMTSLRSESGLGSVGKLSSTKIFPSSKTSTENVGNANSSNAKTRDVFKIDLILDRALSLINKSPKNYSKYFYRYLLLLLLVRLNDWLS